MEVNCQTKEMIFLGNITCTHLPRGREYLGLKTVHYLCALYLPVDPPYPVPSLPPNIL